MESIAEEFYNEEPMRERAERKCVEFHDEVKEGVEYTHYKFRDGSKLTLGSNGYMGCEVPA